MIYLHRWDNDEIKRCYDMAYSNENSNNRYVGLLLPFIGGLLVGGLFVPKNSNYIAPQHQMNPNMYQYPQPMQYPPYYINNYQPYN